MTTNQNPKPRPFLSFFHSTCCGVALGLVLLGCFCAGWLERVSAQPTPLRLGIEVLTNNQGVRLNVTGPTQQFNRIDASTNLSEWRPAGLLLQTAPTTKWADPAATNFPLRFYRARQVNPGTALAGLSCYAGPPGTRVEIWGQFFKAGEPGDNVVTFSGVPAPVLEVTDTHLVTEVPAGAVTGPVTVTTPQGSSGDTMIFTVTGLAEGRFEPPAGMNPADFDIVNTYSLDREPVVGSGAWNIPVGVAVPTTTVAAPRDTNCQTFFFAVSLTPEQPVVLNAASTAEALVFLSPVFATRDPFLAEHVLRIARADTNVQALARTIEQVYPQGGDPSDNPVFMEAYERAVLSVATNASLQALGQEVRQAAASADPPLREDVFRMGMDYLNVTGSGLSYRVESRCAINPVDWVVRVNEVDIARAFPEGRRDFNRAWQIEAHELVPWAARSGFQEDRRVPAELLTDRIKVLGYLVGELFDWLVGPRPYESPVNFANREGIYLVRCVGPAFTPADEADFTRRELPAHRDRALAINLVALVVDTVSISFDLTVIPGINGILEDLLLEAVKKAPGCASGDDVVVATFELHEVLLERAVDALAEEAANGLANSGKFLGKLGGAFLRKLSVWLEILDKIGTVGNVVERARGIAKTTPLESAFIMVGDPFRLEIVGMPGGLPVGGSPGDDIQIIIRSARFDPNNVRDAVYFGANALKGVVLAASAPNAQGEQTLTVRLPLAMSEWPDGEYDLTIQAQGRRGEAKFRLAKRPSVSSLDPIEGFAATDDFAGAPFPGTEITLTGFGFGPEDTFLFPSGTGGTNRLEAFDKSGSEGWVRLNVPKGAGSGRITIIRRPASGDPRVGESPAFTVLGAPAIKVLSPETGPVGTTVELQVDNRGNSTWLVVLRFDDSDISCRFASPDRILATVPLAMEPAPGQPNRTVVVTVITPAGQAQRPFVVTPGRAWGGTIIVGGDSPITLERALYLANLPVASVQTQVVDDADCVEDPETHQPVWLDPPYEEGDYIWPDIRNESIRWPVGAEYADRIEITGMVAGGLVMPNKFDTISGGVIQGGLTVVGDQNTIETTIEGAADIGLIVRGHDNSLVVVCTNNGGHGLWIDGGRANRLSVTTVRNGGDGLRLEAATANSGGIQAAGNDGHGVLLTGGAAGNELSVTTQITDPGTGEPLGPQGNGGHGVFLDGQATGNTLWCYNLVSNRLDGLRLDGVGVTENQVSGDASFNGGYGVIITNGPSRNVINMGAHTNGLCGIALVAGSGPVPTANWVGGGCLGNSNYGMWVSGIADAPGATVVTVTAWDWDEPPAGNGLANLRLDQGTSGVQAYGYLRGAPVGLELDGADVVSNRLDCAIWESAGPGAVVTAAQQNRLMLGVFDCAGTGLLIRSGHQNVLSLNATGNGGDGLCLTDGATGNQLDKHLLLERNRVGLVLQNGARNNYFYGGSTTISNEPVGILILSNRQHGVVIEGSNTCGNRILQANIFTNGPGGDGVRIQNGATENYIGTDAAGGGMILGHEGAGIRVAGAGTRDNVVLGTVIQAIEAAQAPPNAERIGIVVEDHAQQTIIGGFTDRERNHLTLNSDGIHIRSGAQDVVIQNNRIEANEACGVRVTDSSRAFIGGAHPQSPNLIAGSQNGVALLGPATTGCQISQNLIVSNNIGVVISNGAAVNSLNNSNTIELNDTGILIAGAFGNQILENHIRSNQTAGVCLSDGATDNLVRDNRIVRNGVGVQVRAQTTRRNTIRHNSITANDNLGIDLIDGGNLELPAPVLTTFSSHSVIGTANAPDGSLVEIFQDPEDEGEKPIGLGPVAGGRFNVRVNLKPVQVNSLFRLTGTVTDPQGNTSEFGQLAPSPWPLAQIVFASTRSGNRELYLLNGFTPEPVRLTLHPADDYSPVLSPDSARVAFVSTREGDADIYTMPLQPEVAPTRLTTDSAPDYDPAWSADGQLIVFVSERDGNPEIYVMDANGSNVRRLTSDAAADGHPTFSPDGSKVAFSSNRTGAFDLFVMNADGSNPQRLTSLLSADTEPAWSPDGQWIAFVSDRDGNPELYLIRPDGTDMTRLTDHPAADLDPAWLPGGCCLIFASNRDAGFELYLVANTGGPVQRLEVSDGDTSHPHAACR